MNQNGFANPNLEAGNQGFVGITIPDLSPAPNQTSYPFNQAGTDAQNRHVLRQSLPVSIFQNLVVQLPKLNPCIGIQ